MKWKIWDSGEKAKPPPVDSQEDDTLPKTFTVTVFCGQPHSEASVHVTAESRFSKGDLTTVLEKAIRPVIAGQAPGQWDAVLQARLGEIQAELQVNHPGAQLTIKNISVQLAKP